MIFSGIPPDYVCDTCKEDYGSCDLFSTYSLTVLKYNKPYLRSGIVAETEGDDKDEDDEESDRQWEFLFNESIVAVANDSLRENLWFIKIIDNNCIVDKPEPDSYGNVIINGVCFLKGHFLECVHEEKGHILYKLSNRVTNFYRECVLYPFVPLLETEKGYKLMTSDLADIITFVEKNGYKTIC